jgi:uncharacterized membrane protein
MPHSDNGIIAGVLTTIAFAAFVIALYFRSKKPR